MQGNIKARLSSKKNWFRLGRTIVFVADIIPLQSDSFFPVEEIILHLIEEFSEIKDALSLHKNIENKRLLRNYRGRPSSTISNFKHQNEEIDIEELFYLSGKIITNKEEKLDLEGSLEPFSLSFLTRFESLSKANIFYNCFTTQTGLPTREHYDLDRLQNMLQEPSLVLDSVRLGFEKFDQEYWGTYFGLFPTIYGSLYLEINTNHITVHCQEQNCSAEQLLPFEKQNYLKILDKIFSKLEVGDNLIDRCLKR